MVAVRSFSRNAPVAPKKARVILDEVRGKRVDEAIAMLRFMQSPHAKLVAKAVRSAAANAENNYDLNPRNLRVSQAFVGDGERFRRMVPRARGRGDIIHRRRSNITIVVEEVQ
ncbi:MAG TPA: 50S ribosomal protein L22 [Dehalococcoidia bacterium]|nr:50S ribosomal protein L22 [Dehalococcoidia bacterium]